MGEDTTTDLDLTTSRGVFERRDGVAIVDVREPNEWDAGHVEGSTFIPLNRLLGGAGEDLPRDRPIVLVCRTGNRSEIATLLLKARGHEAYNLARGLEEWEREGLPLVAPDGQPGRVV
jgi:rhodanese-related sulfurtransferase